MAALVTKEEVLEWMGMSAGSDADDILDKLVISVSERCQKYARCTFEPVSNAWDITGDGTNLLILPVRPVISVEKVSVLGGEDLVEGWDKGYVVEGSIIRLVVLRFSNWPGSNHIEWTSGYMDVPEDIKLSLWKACAFELKAQDKRRQGVTQSSDAMGGTTTYIKEEYPQDVLDVWESYRPMVIA